ncbi:hypothetical protein DFP72DRAFT_811968, partial [Ephemerocybe angulata]
REIFAQQPNRLFIRVLVITESRVRLIQYDRAGAVYSPLINYHKDPDTLIRLVVGLSSICEAELGLDDTVRWSSPQGKKTHGAIMMFDEKTEKYTKYKMRNLNPFFKSDALFGRGTRMWDVAGADGQKLLVKDAWIGTVGTTAEHVSLKKAVDVLGVQQLVDHEDRTGTEFGEIDYLRPSPEKGDVYAFENRIFQRIITIRYGAPIDSFKSEGEVLAALRDAIAAHEQLVNAGILHCDISRGNILLGESNAPEGLRGILIDLDMAMEIMYDKKPIDSRTGTRYSQSQLLLRGQGLPFRPAHDHLDDLESFFWVLMHIIFDHVQHSQKWAKEFIALCNSTDELDSGRAKRAFLDGNLLDSQIPDCWTQECKDMLIAFHGLMGSIAIQKERIIGTMTEEWDPTHMHALHAQKTGHYEEILEMIDEALGAPGSDRALPLA